MRGWSLVRAGRHLPILVTLASRPHPLAGAHGKLALTSRDRPPGTRIADSAERSDPDLADARAAAPRTRIAGSAERSDLDLADARAQPRQDARRQRR